LPSQERGRYQVLFYGSVRRHLPYQIVRGLKQTGNVYTSDGLNRYGN